MVDNEFAYEKCLRDLQRRGNKQHGLVTYNDIAEVFAARKLDTTVEAIDRICELLEKEEIKIVDYIPEDIVLTKGTASYQENTIYRNNKTRPLFRSLHFICDSSCDPFQDVLYCSEKTIDCLLDLSLTNNNSLTPQDILKVKEDFNLSEKDLYYLCECISSYGIEIQALDNIFHIIKYIDRQYSEYGETEFWEPNLFYSDFYIDYYLKYVFRLKAMLQKEYTY
ncbi:MAG TPA: RNA polymerase sigma factor region1.1 domain-containing protein [Bacillota bacterium]|nr:RNA polymerase sigma factor region1.1 domain-containing protein [Bacillota bacterium]